MSQESSQDISFCKQVKQPGRTTPRRPHNQSHPGECNQVNKAHHLPGEEPQRKHRKKALIQVEITNAIFKRFETLSQPWIRKYTTL